MAATEISHGAALYFAETASQCFFYDFIFLIKFNLLYHMKELYFQSHPLPKCTRPTHGSLPAKTEAEPSGFLAGRGSAEGWIG